MDRTIEIQPAGFHRLANVPCKYCLFEHRFELLKIEDHIDTEYIFRFKREDFTPTSFLSRLDDAKRYLKFSRLKKAVDVVALDKTQVESLLKLLDPKSDNNFPIDVKWKEDTDGWWIGAPNVELDDLVLSVELIKHSTRRYIESVSFGWKLHERYTRKDLRRDYLRYLLYGYLKPFDEYEISLTAGQMETVISFLHYVQRHTNKSIHNSANEYLWIED